MYSADLRDQMFSAALPLKPFDTWPGSAETLVFAVPPAPAIAGLAIDAVRVQLILPSGQVATCDATHVSGTPLWSATFDAENFAVSGFVEKGLIVMLGGKDEKGTSRVWIVARGDLTVREGDASPVPAGSYFLIKMRSAAPATPIEGDAYISGSTLYIYQDGAWTSIGGGGGSDPEKLDGAAAYPMWFASPPNPYRVGDIVSHRGYLWRCVEEGTEYEPFVSEYGWEEVTLEYLKQDALTAQQLANIEAVPEKAPLESPVFTGTPAAPTAPAGTNTTQVATTAFVAGSLPYALVEPGKWEFSGSGVQDGVEYYIEIVDGGADAEYNLYDGGVILTSEIRSGVNETVINFASVSITATRPSLPGHLLDRANNLIDATSGNVTLTLPEYQAGKLRDLLVYVDLGDDGTDPYSITFNFPSGESNTGFKVEGDDPTSATFPAPAAAGEWWYSFTECKPHKFAVSLKQLQDAPQAQGGS